LTTAIKQEFERRLGEARERQAERDGCALRASLARVVAAARPGRDSLVIAVGRDGIQAGTIVIDHAGTPVVRAEGTLAWEVVLPWLPPDATRRHAALAGAGGQVSGDRIAALIRGKLPSGGGAVLVIAWPAGWRTLEAVADAAVNAAGPAASAMRVVVTGDIPIGAILAGVVAAAPLRRPYYLMTASVDGVTGNVQLRPRKIFDAGAAPGAVATVNWRRLPGDVGDVTVAVFASETPAPPVALYRVPVPAGAQGKLRIVLAGTGRVRVAEPAGAIAHPGTWGQVLAQVPPRVVTAAAPADLVCAVDLSGDLDTVRRRKALARELIQLLEAEYPGTQRLQVAIVTCTDHVFGRVRGLEDEPVTEASELGTAAEALECLAMAEGADPKDGYCTPVEDMLREAADLLAGSARRGRRPRLVTLAGRPPHPYPLSLKAPDMMPCPRKHDWRQIVSELDTLRASYAVVVDQLPRKRDKDKGQAGWKQADWDRLGPAGQRALPSARARDIARDLGLLAGPGQCLSLPLADAR
jgi:hypothetical protein